jgi:hypothetical protein
MASCNVRRLCVLEKGSLEPGQLADLAVLSQDIFEVSPDQLPATRSLLTLVGGSVMHASPPFEEFDTE